MRKLLALLLVSLIFFLVYNAYTYHQLSSAEGAYKLAGISGDEKLIAVYHDSNFWQFATYNPKTQELKVYYIGQNLPLLFRTKKTKTVKTPLNYSPLALDLKLLEKAPKETPALLFAGKWYTRKNPPKFPTAEQIAKEYENKTLRELTAYYARKELWIGSIILQTGDVIYGGIGPGRILVVPALQDNISFVWYAEIPVNANVSLKRAAYPGDITVKGTGKTSLSTRPFIITGRILNRGLTSALRSIEEYQAKAGQKTEFASITFYCYPENITWGLIFLDEYWKGISMERKIPRAYGHIDVGDTHEKCNKT